jgi:hypothetical protein
VVGLGVGTIFGPSAKSKYKESDDVLNDPANQSNCPPGGACELYAQAFDERTKLIEDGDSAKTLSLVGFIAGGVGVAAGVTLFIVSSGKKEQPAAATVEPYVGVGALGVRGSF